jgi:hypothetical protein
MMEGVELGDKEEELIVVPMVEDALVIEEAIILNIVGSI